MMERAVTATPVKGLVALGMDLAAVKSYYKYGLWIQNRTLFFIIFCFIETGYYVALASNLFCSQGYP